MNILIVEDDARDVEILKSKLKKHTIGVCRTLAAGIEAMRRNRWDCVLLDMNLTNGSRDHVLSDMMKVSQGTAIVVLTGYHDPQFRDAVLGMGAHGFAMKGKDDRQPADLEWIITTAVEFARVKRGKVKG